MTSPSEFSAKDRKRALFTLFLVVCIDLIGFGIVIPILPYYASEFGATAFQLGWLMTSYSLMQFLFSPVWGAVSDRIGRKPVLIMSIFATAATLALMGFAQSLAWLFVGRIAAGMSAANISTAYAYVSDVTTDENRAKGMGLIGAGFGLGFIIGPAIGGLLSVYGYGVPLLFAAGLALINGILAIRLLREPPLDLATRSSHRFKRFALKEYSRVLAHPLTRLAIGTSFLVTLAVTQMEVCFAIFMAAKFGYDAKHAGMLLGLMGVVMVIMQGGLIGRLSRRFSEIPLITIGAAIASASLFSFAVTPTVSGVVLALVLYAIGGGMINPSLSSLASKGAPSDLRGSTMGVYQSAGSLARVIGPPTAGLLYDQVSQNSPFISGVILLAVVTLISLMNARTGKARLAL